MSRLKVLLLSIVFNLFLVPEIHNCYNVSLKYTKVINILRVINNVTILEIILIMTHLKEVMFCLKKIVDITQYQIMLSHFLDWCICLYVTPWTVSSWLGIWSSRMHLFWSWLNGLLSSSSQAWLGSVRYVNCMFRFIVKKKKTKKTFKYFRGVVHQ